VQCTADNQCQTPTGFCDLTTNTCVRCTQDANCPSGRVCTNNTCQCPTGQQSCGGQCVDVLSDAQNCGNCGNACNAGSACQAGTCACGTGMTLCGGGIGGFGQCRDLQTDARSCGTCGNACPTGQLCDAGKCACRTGETLCNGQCVDTSSDPNHCGGCDLTKACAVGQACLAGKCVDGGATACADPTPDACTVALRTACVNQQTDPLHCGGCLNSACAGNEVCVAGNCQRYRAATGCNTCPCDATCAATVPQGTDVTCCAGPTASKAPVCVAGVTACQ
jgi:Cys-rich repeat protein